MEAVWESARPSSGQPFDASLVSSLPAPVRRYISHAIAPSTPLASAVRLHMHGEIKLGGWRSFRAEQVITRDGELVWAATVSINGVPIRGSDKLLNGAGSMEWRLFDLIPVMKASGPDITRSGIGRLLIELTVWNPSMLLGDGVSWGGSESSRPRVRVETLGESAEIELEIADEGRLKTAKMLRWGNPDGGEFAYETFSAIVDDERSFSGITIPSRIRVGWYFGTERFDSSGEFFRATIDKVTFK